MSFEIDIHGQTEEQHNEMMEIIKGNFILKHSLIAAWNEYKQYRKMMYPLEAEEKFEKELGL